VFVYRRLGRHWGIGFGLPVFIFIVLPLWIAWTILKTVAGVTVSVLPGAYKLACSTWRRRHRSYPPPASWFPGSTRAGRAGIGVHGLPL